MEVLDVEVVDPPPPIAYDSIKARSAMKESETGLVFVRQQEICDDDWEEKVNKAGKALFTSFFYFYACVILIFPSFCFSSFRSLLSGWTSSQSRLFNRVVRELTADRLARLSIVGSDNEPLQLRLLVDKSARRFRQIMATVQWDKKMCALLHKVLLDHIPSSFLVAYLDILQSLK